MADIVIASALLFLVPALPATGHDVTADFVEEPRKTLVEDRCQHPAYGVSHHILFDAPTVLLLQVEQFLCVDEVSVVIGLARVQVLVEVADKLRVEEFEHVSSTVSQLLHMFVEHGSR